MKKVYVPPFYQIVAEYSTLLPTTTKAILEDRMDMIKLTIADKANRKLNLIICYSIASLITLTDTICYGRISSFFLCILFTIIQLIIQRDLEELLPYKQTIDKLREPDIGSFKPGTIGPFGF